MYELIAIIILISSISGILIILLRRIPVLVELPNVIERPQKESPISRLEKKLKTFVPEEKILQKILSRFRILVLKVEKKTDNLLQRLRKKSQQNQKVNDKDWQNLKELIDKKFKDLPR